MTAGIPSGITPSIPAETLAGYFAAGPYGNFLGLGQLQAYVAGAVGLRVGELLMTINHVELDGNPGAVKAALARIAAG